MESRENDEQPKPVNVRDHIHPRGKLLTPRTLLMLFLALVLIVGYAFLRGATWMGIAYDLDWLGLHLVIGFVIGFLLSTFFVTWVQLRFRRCRLVRNAVHWVVGTKGQTRQSAADSGEQPTGTQKHLK